MVSQRNKYSKKLVLGNNINQRLSCFKDILKAFDNFKNKQKSV